MHTKSTSPHVLAVAAVALGLGAGPTHGDVILAQWNSSSSYSYWVTHVPDFDQRRIGLPGNAFA